MTLFSRAALLFSLIAAAPSVLAVERSGRDSVYVGSNAKALVLNKRPAAEIAPRLVDSNGEKVTTGQAETIVQPFGRDSVYGAPTVITPIKPVEVAPAPAEEPAPFIPPAPIIAPALAAKPKPVIALAPEPASAPPTAPVLVYRTDLENRQWTERLNRIRDDVRIESNHHRNVTGAAAVTVSAFSSGYLIWLLRGGLLLTSLLSTLPAWQTLDPLPILAAKRRRQGEEETPDLVDRLFDESSNVDDAPREATTTAQFMENNHSGVVVPSAVADTLILNPQSR